MKLTRSDEMMLYIADNAKLGPSELTQRAIAKGVGKDISDVSRCMKKLEKDGYIAKFVHTNYRGKHFSVLIYALTESGNSEIEVLRIRKGRRA